MKRASLILILFTFLQCIPAISQDKSEYEKHIYVGKRGDTLLYRLLVPKDYDATKKYPLIVYLHGSGERGNDNEFQLHHGWKTFLVDSIRENYPTFVLFPQCPLEERWYSKEGKPTKTLLLVNKAVDKLTAEQSIDVNRLYVMGLSMGGYGTFGCIETWPNKYAAAIPICGWANITKAKKYAKRTAVWLFHGSDDTAVIPERSREVYAELKAKGCNVCYTEYPGVGHNSWTPALAEPELFKWLFSKSKK